VVANLSDETRSVRLSNAAITGEYRRLFRKGSVRLDGEVRVELEPWSYRVLERPAD
jgi:hypothetical protein